MTLPRVIAATTPLSSGLSPSRDGVGLPRGRVPFMAALVIFTQRYPPPSVGGGGDRLSPSGGPTTDQEPDLQARRRGAPGVDHH